ncbi:Vacuolar membrane amino acid uptake transporter fnx2 [Grifola frondosa]|uniref:Vacuolar membrane amino acid uptake transporter fnx2 n=1 Tax=Grifola frondosa TaxID=5627 RepID=A0A1C7M7Q9_GRIFR|nr:Vacuolar membrane amino acid uptake transporter fnx2 [Grifola frondosa]
MTATPDEETALLAESPATYGISNEHSESIGDHSPSDSNSDEEELKPQVSLVAIMVPMLLGIFLVAMDTTIVTSTYASIGSQFEQLQNTSWIATGYMLSLTSFQPLYGKATARALAGIGGGGMSTVASIVMSDIVPLRQRGTFQGFANIAFAAGQATGAPLGGVLADSIGWRWAFIIQVPLTVLAILIVSLGLKLPKTSGGDFHAKLRRVDFGGAIALVIAVFALLLGLDRGGNISWDDRITIASLSAAAVLFVWRCQGASAAQAGMALLPSVVGSVAGSLVGGLIMQTTGRYYWLTVGVFGLMLAGSVVMALFTGVLAYSFAWLVVGLVVTSFGNGIVLILCVASTLNISPGAGITTTLIALIANAGPEDQAIATAGKWLPPSEVRARSSPSEHVPVSYLFRSLGSVVCLSVGTTITQDTLRKRLYERLTGADVDEIVMRVRESLEYLEELKPEVRKVVLRSYQDGIQAALWFTVALSACAVVISFFIKEKPLAR